MNAFFTQSFPPKPTFTELEIPSLAGKVFIVTGGNAGLGLEVVKILYSRGGTVYIAGRRTPAQIETVIEKIKSDVLPIITSTTTATATAKTTTGTLNSLYVDLNDLSTIAKCVSDFTARESRLDVLWNNAGITEAAKGSKTTQGHEALMGINCLAPYLLTKLLLPILRKTSESAPKGSVRVVFTSSQIIDLKKGPPGGVSMTDLRPDSNKLADNDDVQYRYSMSKAGNWMLASEFDKRVRDQGIVCLTQNPGNLRTTGFSQAPWLLQTVFKSILHHARMGAYTGIWAGLSPDVKCEDGGKYVIPWGRWHPSPRQDILQSLKVKEEGGTGVAAEFWNWCEEHTAEYNEMINS